MVEDVYFLMVHEPYEEPGAPAPVNGPFVGFTMEIRLTALA